MRPVTVPFARRLIPLVVPALLLAVPLPAQEPETGEPARAPSEEVEEAAEAAEMRSPEAERAGAEDDPRREVIAADRALAAAVAAAEPEAFAALVAEDAVFLGGTGALRGRDAVVEGWGSLLAEERTLEMTWTPSGVRMADSGELAYTIGEYRLTAVGGEQSSVVDEGRYLSVWRKEASAEGDAIWRVVADGPLRRDRAFYLEQELERQGRLGPGTGAVLDFRPERTVEAESEDLSYTLGTYRASRVTLDGSEELLATGDWLAVWAKKAEDPEAGYLPGGDSVTPPPEPGSQDQPPPSSASRR